VGIAVLIAMPDSRHAQEILKIVDIPVILSLLFPNHQSNDDMGVQLQLRIIRVPTLLPTFK
jgi:hypothetical protein